MKPTRQLRLPLALGLLGLGLFGWACDPAPKPNASNPASNPTSTGVTQATPSASPTPQQPEVPFAELKPLGLGKAATPEEIAAWDIDVDPSGHGLPPGKGTVEEGRALYATQCIACHGPKGEGGVGPKLIGAEPKTGFADDWKIPKTIGNWWPYATTVYDYIHRAMPQHAPGSMTPDQTYALTAFLLAENGAVPADFVATAESLPKVKMPTIVQFIPDDREGTTEFR